MTLAHKSWNTLNFQVRSSMVAGNLMIPLMRHIGQVPVTTCTLESPDLMKLVLRDSTLSCHRGRCPSQRFTCYVMLSNRSGHEFCHFNVCFFCEHDFYSFSSTVVRYGKNLGACIWEAKKSGGGCWPESCGSEIVRHMFVCFLNETLCKRWDILHINRFVRMFFNSCSNFKWLKMMEFIVYGCLWHCFLPKMTSFFVDFCMSSSLPNLQSDFCHKTSNWSCFSLVEYILCFDAMVYNGWHIMQFVRI